MTRNYSQAPTSYVGSKIDGIQPDILFLHVVGVRKVQHEPGKRGDTGAFLI